MCKILSFLFGNKDTDTDTDTYTRDLDADGIPDMYDMNPYDADINGQDDNN